jgi:polynucleotide 5'-hydroxyl-kinase GRC3/NOL9
MTLDIPAAWSEALAGIVGAGGACMVLGPVDAGKTTFCAVLAAEALKAHVKVALVDADPGQSDIGPPAAVGAAVVQHARQLEELESIPADALSFVGTTSPPGHLLQLAAATHDMVAHARAAGAKLIIVDTTGLVDGGFARALKAAKVDLLRPRHVVALQHQDEVEHLLAPYRNRDEPRTWRLRASRRAQARDRDQRKAKRERRFAAYFASATGHELSWGDVGLEQTPWLTGEPVPGHLAAYVEELAEGEVLHAERVETGIFAIVKGLAGAAHRSIKGGELNVRVIDAGLLENLLVGLMDASGHTLAMGIMTGVDFKRRRFAIHAPVRTLEHVRGLRLGSMRVGADGVELGHGEIA